MKSFLQQCDTHFFLETVEVTHADGWCVPGGIMRLFIPSNGNRESSGVDCGEIL